jgi:hypothetical protein
MDVVGVAVISVVENVFAPVMVSVPDRWTTLLSIASPAARGPTVVPLILA